MIASKSRKKRIKQALETPGNPLDSGRLLLSGFYLSTIVAPVI